MARSFNLWNFYRHADFYEFDVTQADSSGLQAGTRDWIAECLAAAGVDGSIQSWELTPGRSMYYSDYLVAADWQDRWTRCWTVKVIPDGDMQPASNRLADAPLSILNSDPTWDDAAADPQLDQTALIIVDYKADASFVESQAQAVLAQANLSYSDAQVELRQYDAQIHQLRLRLLGELFPEQSRSLDRLIERFKATGGATNWRDRLDWFKAKPEITPEIQSWMDQLLGRRESE